MAIMAPFTYLSYNKSRISAKIGALLFITPFPSRVLRLFMDFEPKCSHAGAPKNRSYVHSQRGKKPFPILFLQYKCHFLKPAVFILLDWVAVTEAE